MSTHSKPARRAELIAPAALLVGVALASVGLRLIAPVVLALGAAGLVTGDLVPPLVWPLAAVWLAALVVVAALLRLIPRISCPTRKNGDNRG
jgi:hypothetical protein